MPISVAPPRDKAPCEGSDHRHLDRAEQGFLSFNPRSTASIQTSPPNSSNAADFLDVILAGGLVRSFEEASRIFAEPLGQLMEFFAETIDGLLVHVCLGDEFGE